MLMTMKALTGAARCICYLTAEAIDRARRRADAAARRHRRSERASLLTPVAKAFSTDIGVRGRLARRPGPWRHGLRRGDRRGAASARRPHRPDLRGHERHPGDRPRCPQAAALAGRRRAPADRGHARDRAAARQGGDAGLRLDRRAAARGDREPRSRDELHAEGRLRQPARGGARRRDAVSAPVRAGAGRRRPRPRRRSLRAPRRRPAIPIRRTRPGSRSAASSPRTSRPRRAGWRRASSSGPAFVDDAPLALAS